MPVERNALICARGFVARIACRQAELGFVAGNSGHLGVWRMTGELGARNNRVSDLAEEDRERVRNHLRRVRTPITMTIQMLAFPRSTIF